MKIAQISIKDLASGLYQLMSGASDTAYSVSSKVNWEKDAAFILNPGLLAWLPDELSVLENPTRFVLGGVGIPVVLEDVIPYSDSKTFVYLLIREINGREILCPDEDQPGRIKNLAPWLQSRLEINFPNEVS